MWRQVGRWRGDAGGGVAILFGLTALVLVGCVGAAIDYSRAASIKGNLQRAIDGAALLAAKNHDQIGDTLSTEALATNYVRQTFSTGKIDDMKVRITFREDRVVVDGSANVPTTIMNVLGIRNVPVSGTSEVLFGDTKLEIVLVLDNTGSMNQQSKLDTLKKASNNFLTKMQSASGNLANLKIGIVPFENDVNLGTLKTAKWVDTANIQRWSTNPSTAGCIWDRASPNDVTDAPPNSSDTLFSADADRTGPCTLAPITELTSDFKVLHSVVDSMTASGSTNLTIGLVWGLHLLTSSEPITGAAPIGTKNVAKYMIFMTDGLNNKSRDIKADNDQDTVKVNALNERTKQVCANIKSAGIQVFTAKIIQGDDTILRNCATTPSMYYEVLDVAQLNPAFDSIYSMIVGARIAR